MAEVISSADAFRKSKLFAKALTTLRIGLELDPRSVPIQERIRDILIETGETDLAIREMVNLGAILIEDGDLQGAYDNLAWILEADPGHSQATRLYERLQAVAGGGSLDESLAESLSESLDESQVKLERHVAQRSGSGSFDELDDPTMDAPLPSYPLGKRDDEPLVPRAGDTARVGGAWARRYSSSPAEDFPIDSDSLPAYELDEGDVPREIMPPGMAGEPGPASSEHARGPSLIPEVEAALEEAEFYANQGVYETARETVEEALRASPRNALLVEKLREIEAAAAAIRPVSSIPSRLSDRAFDIAASLDALDQLEEPRSAAIADQIDVEEVFAKFKMGVAQQVDASDSQTHYDLGIAYEQMMLYDDAIQEFRIASRDPWRLALCQSMIAMIFEKKGKLTEATEAYKMGLQSQQLTQDEELALLYQLGDIWERRNNRKEAAHYFKRVVSADMTYRDCKSRLDAIEANPPDKGSGARPKKEIDEELDVPFDDVVDGGKKKKSN